MTINHLIQNVERQNIQDYFKQKIAAFRPIEEELTHIIQNEANYELFTELFKLGEVEFEDSDELLVFSCQYNGELSNRSSKRKQFEIAKKVLNEDFKDGAIFLFYDKSGKFRFSFIRKNYGIKEKKYSNWKRYTYFVNPEKPNKTYRKQIENCKFDSLHSIHKAFSIDAVTDEFYNEFKPKFDEISNSIAGDIPFSIKQDFALLFAIRTIFIGFVQKRKWLGDDENFVQSFYEEYKKSGSEYNSFYKNWYEPLLFQALNSPPGTEVDFHNTFSKETGRKLKMAPFLNGELFMRKKGIDTVDLFISDSKIKEFSDFLFSYNFTIEENTKYDEELELNPEFLGIIFERIVNKENGAVYTPRMEVDFMCRISLVKWLQKVSSLDINDLYHLFFIEMGIGDEFKEYQKEGDFSTAEIKELLRLLKEVTVCDPASGSGAFPVGMMQVLNEVIENIQNRKDTPAELRGEKDFERKKSIIVNSLYGVEVKQWAVWINQLRLWLSLFVDIPTDRDFEFMTSKTPLLPNLDFKIRCGDSLVQRIGEKLFPIEGHIHELPSNLKSKITQLKKDKVDFYYNRASSLQLIKDKENEIYRLIIDQQINDKINEILRLKRPIEKQVLLYAAENDNSEHEYKEKRINILEEEIEALNIEKAAFIDEHPLIWSIEFAEIFYEREGFDIVIGNPPYVRQEDISDPNGHIVAKDYKLLLQKSIRNEFPKHFVKKEKIDGKSDLYTYFYLKTLRLLNSKGIHTFICSNSWLNVGYGAWIQKFLLKHCLVHFIIENQAKRSFANADVNTIISIIDSPLSNRKEFSPERKYKFISFKKPFEEVIFSENLIDIEHQQNQICDNNFFRSYAISIEKLTEDGSLYENLEEKKLKLGKYFGNKWGGKYLKSPAFILDIMSSSRVSCLDNFVELKYGLKTGKVEFFYIDIANSQEIEEEYLFPAVVSSQDFESILIKPTHYIFNCSKDKKQLLNTKALDYINYGEQNGLNIGTSVESHRPYWYSLKCQEIETVFLRFWDKRFFIPFTEEKLTCSDNFCYGNFRCNPKVGKILVNSTFFFLQIELFGSNNQGQGVLTTYMEYDYKFIKLPLLEVNEEKFKKILDSISKRKIENIFIECGIDPESDISIFKQIPKPLPDRKDLDDIVFDSLNLTSEERNEVYRTVCQLVWNRISKANSV